MKTMFYNSFQNWRCILGLKLLDITHFDQYTKYKGRLASEAGSFTTFLYEIATETAMEDYECSVLQLSVPAGNMQAPIPSVQAPNTKALKRSKVQRILKSPSANLVRLNQQSSHLASRSTPKGAWKGQTACDMCCRVCSTKHGELIANVAPHKRKGFPGFVSCSICNVVLCTKPRMQHHGLTHGQVSSTFHCTHNNLKAVLQCSGAEMTNFCCKIFRTRSLCLHCRWEFDGVLLWEVLTGCTEQQRKVVENQLPVGNVDRKNG